MLRVTSAVSAFLSQHTGLQLLCESPWRLPPQQGMEAGIGAACCLSRDTQASVCEPGSLVDSAFHTTKGSFPSLALSLYSRPPPFLSVPEFMQPGILTPGSPAPPSPTGHAPVQSIGLICTTKPMGSWAGRRRCSVYRPARTPAQERPL